MREVLKCFNIVLSIQGQETVKQGKTMKTKALFAVRVGQPDYMEDLITDKEELIEQAKEWALKNGFDRPRIAVINLDTPPDFTKTISK